MKLSRRIIAFLLPPIYNLWAATLRYEQIGREVIERLNAKGEKIIVCLWHGEIFGMWKLKKHLKLVAVISQSKDGEFLTKVVTKLGFRVVRGSSSRGGIAALRGVVRAMIQDGYSPCVTMDGPRGPKHKVKDGVFFMAHYGDAWLVPIRALYFRAIRLKSWDGFFIPLPFSKVRVVFGEPYKIEADEFSSELIAKHRNIMTERMEELEKHLPAHLRNK